MCVCCMYVRFTLDRVYSLANNNIVKWNYSKNFLELILREIKRHLKENNEKKFFNSLLFVEQCRF